MICKEYHDKFKSLSEAYISCWRTLRQEAGLVKTMLIRAGTTRDAATPTKLQEAIEDVRDRYLGALFLMNSDPTRFNGLLIDLENDYLLNQDNLPTSLTKAYNMLTYYRSSNTGKTSQYDAVGQENLAFVANNNEKR